MTSLPQAHGPAPTAADTAGAPAKSETSLLRRLQDAGVAPLLVLVLLVAVIGIIDHGFFTPRSIASLLEQSTPLALLAIGQCLVVLTGRIDLSNAALASLCGVLLAQTLGSLGVASVPLVLLGGAVAGAVIGWITSRRRFPRSSSRSARWASGPACPWCWPRPTA